jgi:protein-tyrosine-phosphatase
MKIHYICKANVFRSRIAEAYTNAKQLPDILCSSSGFDAGNNDAGDVCWEFELLAEIHTLVPFMSRTWQKTQLMFLQDADIVIYLDDNVYTAVKGMYPTIDEKQHEIWDITDLPDLTSDDETEILYHIQKSKEDFVAITKKVDMLLAGL